MPEKSNFTINKESLAFKELQRQKFSSLSPKERQKMYDEQLKKISLQSFLKQVPLHCIKIASHWGALFTVLFVGFVIFKEASCIYMLGFDHYMPLYSWQDPFYVGGIVTSYFFAIFFFIAVATRLDALRMISQAFVIYCGAIIFHLAGSLLCFAWIASDALPLHSCAAINVSVNLIAVLLYIFTIVVNEKKLFSCSYNKLASFFSYPGNQFYLDD